MSIVYNFMMFAGSLMLANAAFSMLQYRRFVQLGGVEGDPDTLIQPPLDIQVEAILGMLTAIVGAVFKYTATLNRISLNAVLASQTKTYEQATNMHRSGALRNLQRTRGGVVFAKSFPDAHKVLTENAALTDVIGRAI